MVTRVLQVLALFALVAVAQCGVVPVSPYAAAVAPYASSYNAHTVTHSVAAAPLAAAPLAVAPAAYTAYSALPAYHPLGAYPAAAAYTTFV